MPEPEPSLEDRDTRIGPDLWQRVIREGSLESTETPSTDGKAPTRTALVPAASVPDGQTPPVIAADHPALLRSDDPAIAANKRLCYDMYRVVLQAGRADRIGDFIGPGYIQHNPNVMSGPEALATFIRGSRPEREIRPVIALPLVSIVAERDMVMFAFVRPERDADGQAYHSSWFDLFRIEDGRIVEHWDPALRSAEMLRLDPNRKTVGD